MIRNFADARTRRLWSGRPARRLPPDIERRALTRLEQLNQAEGLRELAAVPGNRLEALHGDRLGQYSVRVNDQWRICFRWDDGACDVELVDYHR